MVPGVVLDGLQVSGVWFLVVSLMVFRWSGVWFLVLSLMVFRCPGFGSWCCPWWSSGVRGLVPGVVLDGLQVSGVWFLVVSLMVFRWSGVWFLVVSLMVFRCPGFGSWCCP